MTKINIPSKIVEASSGQAAMSNLSNFKVDEYDRKHQIWKRKPLSVQITSQKFLTQKMGYIHKNPGNANLVEDGYDYEFCSFRSYEEGLSLFPFLTLWC